MTEIVIGFVDTETTGLSQEAGHRLIEVAFSCWAYNTATGAKRKLGKRMYVQRINPEREIDIHAYNVHKISLAMLRGAPKWPAVAPVVSKLMGHMDLFIAHNVGFDAPFLALELIRAGFPCPDVKTYCTMAEGRKATGMGKVPNLGELAFACGIPYDSDAAHAADYDVHVLESAYWAGVDVGAFLSPEEILAK